MSVQDRIAKIRSLMEQRGYDALVLRNNADLRGGSNRSKRKSTNPHNDGIKSNRNPKRSR